MTFCIGQNIDLVQLSIDCAVLQLELEFCISNQHNKGLY